MRNIVSIEVSFYLYYHFLVEFYSDHMQQIVQKVATLLKHRGEGALYVHGMEVGMVKVVGQVRNVDLRESSIAYQVV